MLSDDNSTVQRKIICNKSRAPHTITQSLNAMVVLDSNPEDDIYVSATIPFYMRRNNQMDTFFWFCLFLGLRKLQTTRCAILIGVNSCEAHLTCSVQEQNISKLSTRVFIVIQL